MLESWYFFYCNVRKVIENYIPEAQHKKTNKSIWMDILYTVRMKRYTFSRRREDYEKYWKIRNKILKCITYARRKYEKGVAKDAKRNPKAFWK